MIFSILMAMNTADHTMFSNFFENIQKPLLYLVTDSRTFSKEKFLQHIELAIKGGVDVVQFRDKQASDRDFCETAKSLKEITDKYKIPLIINDRIQIAKEIKAAGVHVGQSDLQSSNQFRLGLKNDQFIGFSIINEQQMNHIPDGVCYLGVGPILPTKTKLDASPPIGLDGLRKIRQKTNLPIIAIGGIRKENIQDIINAGANGIAVIGAIMDSDDPEKCAKDLKKILIESHEHRKSHL